MVAWLQALRVAMSGELVAAQAMVLHVALDLGRTALLAVSVVEAVAMAPCRMLAAGRVSTSRRLHTSTLGSGEILMWSGLGEILLAS